MRKKSIIAIIIASVIAIASVMPILANEQEYLNEDAYQYSYVDLDGCCDLSMIESAFFHHCSPGQIVQVSERTVHAGPCAQFCSSTRIYSRVRFICCNIMQWQLSYSFDRITNVVPHPSWTFIPAVPDQYMGNGVWRIGSPSFWRCNGCGRTRA